MPVSEIKIYVFYYKENSVIELSSIYQPIMAGNTFLLTKTGITGDDSGNNISSKNKYYSELTGIYWTWKNTEQSVTGACHYRRYFTAQPEPFLYRIQRLFYYPLGLHKKRLGLIYTKNTKLFVDRIIKQNEISLLLERYDAILPQARKMKYTVHKHYEKYHDINDIILIESILKEKHPGYVEAFHEVLKGKRLYANNMFIMKDVHFQEFMEWWFDVLFEFEKRINLNEYIGYQQRILGFMAERLLNVWFRKKQLNCVELPVIYFKHLKFE